MPFLWCVDRRGVMGQEGGCFERNVLWVEGTRTESLTVTPQGPPCPLFFPPAHPTSPLIADCDPVAGIPERSPQTRSQVPAPLLLCFVTPSNAASLSPNVLTCQMR